MADPPIGSLQGHLEIATASWREYGGRMIATFCRKCSGRPFIAAFSQLMRGKITMCGFCRAEASLSARRAQGLARPARY